VNYYNLSIVAVPDTTHVDAPIAIVGVTEVYTLLLAIKCIAILPAPGILSH
jgi:hypothetical protein